MSVLFKYPGSSELYRLNVKLLGKSINNQIAAFNKITQPTLLFRKQNREDKPDQARVRHGPDLGRDLLRAGVLLPDQELPRQHRDHHRQVQDHGRDIRGRQEDISREVRYQ